MASLSDRKLATRYATALLAVLPDPADAEAADRFLSALQQALARSAEFRVAMNDPGVAAPARGKLLRALAEQHKAPPRLQRFLDVLVAHGRTPVLPTIAQVYREERER